MIIGLTGIIGAGKGTVANILVEKGFKYTSLSDVIREEIKKRKIEITRDSLTSVAKELRVKGGSGVLGEMLSNKLNNSEDFIVDSVRHPKEVQILKEKFPNFILIKITAPLKVCLRRIQDRNRENDPKTLVQLVAQLNKENNDDNQKLNTVIELADFAIKNDSTFEELKKRVEILLEKNYK